MLNMYENALPFLSLISNLTYIDIPFDFMDEIVLANKQNFVRGSHFAHTELVYVVQVIDKHIHMSLFPSPY